MFSVIIPLYNKELSIKNTIQSVLDQSFQDFEIVVVNDGSIDESVKQVERINDHRIRLIHQENQGVSTARNKGIKEAKNEWIAFLDGDDLWMPNHLEEVRDMMQRFPNGKVFVTSFEYSDGRKMNGDSSLPQCFEIDNYFKDYLKFKNLVWTSTVVVNQKCFDLVTGFNPSLALGEDLDLWARLSKKNRIIKSRTITAIYRNDAENRSDVKKYNMKKSFLSIIQFNKMDTLEEKTFYRFWLLHNLKSFVVARDYKNIWYIIRRYGVNLIFNF